MDPNVDLRAHISLVKEAYRHQTSNLPRQAWEAWAYLMGEALRNARLRGLKQTFRMQELELWLETSNAVEGWKTTQLVQGMAGEQPPKGMPAAAFITTAPPGDGRDEDRKKKRGLLERVRR